MISGRSPGRETEPPYAGRLSSQIPGYGSTLGLELLVHTQPVGVRPELRLLEAPHPLFSDQRNGITAERADELIHTAVFGTVHRDGGT